MTIRYHRVGLKIERVVAELDPAGALTRELSAATQEAADIAAQTRDLQRDLARFNRAMRERIAIHRRLFPRMPPSALSGPPLPPTSAEAIRRARALTGVSQRDLAAALGLHRSSIAEAERGTRPSPLSLLLWATRVLLPKEGTSDEHEAEGARTPQGGARRPRPLL